MMNKINIFWFRRDLRLEDNVGLFHALESERPVQPIFIFDTSILSELPKKDARVTFIHQALSEIHEQLQTFGSSLWVFFGEPKEVFSKLIEENLIDTIFTNHDYEPYALERDASIQEIVASKNIDFKTFKDQVIFEKNEVTKSDGTPYTIYTPYSKKWKELFQENPPKNYILNQQNSNFNKTSNPKPLMTLKEIGFEQSSIQFPSSKPNLEIIKSYHETRDFPFLDGTSKLGMHLRFGTISIRECVKSAQGNEKFLNELIWREFYQSILFHFPQVVSNSFKPQYDKIVWRNNEQEFESWCNGQTGYPIVDAGMRELNQTGWMHNRVRMIVASFLTKHLLIDWRWGEAYFAKKLLDFDLASNNGGWQWAAGCGVDAAPYFRIFNPSLQTLKFDKDLKYIKKWVPEFESFNYPKPIVDHTMARERCLSTYKVAFE